MKQQPDVKGGKIMSRKYKWLLSIMMLAVMVIAMATACGSKKEEAAEPEKKEETKVEAEKEAEEEPEEVADDGQQEDVAEVDTAKETLSEEDVLALKSSIRDSVVNNYIIPKGIEVTDFVWPAGNSEAWYYFDLLTVNYTAKNFMGTELEAPTLSDESYKQIMDATFNGLTTWYEASGVDNLNYFESAMGVLSIEAITTIDLSATE